MPHFDEEKCIHCAACDTVCPDFCFVWEEQPDKKGRPQMFLQGIDYQYCKGCLKCVDACPTEALAAERETDGYGDDRIVCRTDFDLGSSALDVEYSAHEGEELSHGDRYQQEK